MLGAPKVATFGVLLLLAAHDFACARRPGQVMTLSGSTSLQPLAEKWVAVYRSRNPELAIAVQGGGSTAGVQATISGAAQVGMVSRSLTPAERLAVREIPVARDGIALVVHPSNPLHDMSRADVRAIYSGRLRTWQMQSGRALPITVITREEGSGTRAAFEGLVLGGLPIVASALVSDSTGAVRQMVATDSAAIGYISIGLIDASVKPLRLSGVEPNERNKELALSVAKGSIHAIIGPSGSGKSSLLRTITLLSREIDQATLTGSVLLDGQDVLGPGVDRAWVRRRIGLVLATPQPLPGSIHHNLTFGPRLGGTTARSELEALVESSLRSADLWDEVKDRLRSPASALSGGQQQRLCIARALALSPEVILLDEPCSGLDPISTAKIEQMMRLLQTRLTRSQGGPASHRFGHEARGSIA